MEPTGSDTPWVYVLGEAPGEDEASQGRQFVGPSGRLLRRQFPVEWENKLRWNNVIRDRPPKNRTPMPAEVECCRPSIVRDIEETKPEVILGVGAVPLNWMLEQGQIGKWRGSIVPVRVGTHACWFVPIFHPSFILRKQHDEKHPGGGQEFKHAFVKDIRRLVKVVDRGLPPAEPEDVTKLRDGCTIIKCSPEGLEELATFIKASRFQATSVDIETSTLRPYIKAPQDSLLSFAIATEDESMSVAFNHPSAAWTRQQRADILDMLEHYLRESRAPVITHNLAFEIEWFIALFGPSIAFAAEWDDSMAQAFVLDERPGTKSLDHCVLRRFGFHLKQQSAVDRANLGGSTLEQLLMYGAMDAKYGRALWVRQRAEVDGLGLTNVYRDQVERIPSAVLMQAKGLPVAFDRVDAFECDCLARIKEIEGRISRLPESREYETRFGKLFNPHSAKACIALLRDILHTDKGKRGKKYSADKAVMASVGSRITSMIVSLRQAQKVYSTYVLPFKRGGEYIHEDGKIHTQYHMARVETRRTSSSDPNQQNWPKRGPAVAVRSVICPGPGYKLVSADYGQMEARVIAMHSRDKAFVESLWTGHDVHMDYAKHLAEMYPPFFEVRNKGDWKKARQDAKTYIVFPAFYGSTPGGMAGDLQIPVQIAERLLSKIFWREFAGVKKWQDEQLQFYDKHGYVKSMRGFRRRMPLRSTQILNTSIQGDASDFTVEANNRLARRALENHPELQPVMNVHDDLTFIVPTDILDVTIDTVVHEMLDIRYDWVNVPLLVEVSVGDDWGSMKEVRKVQSNEL